MAGERRPLTRKVAHGLKILSRIDRAGPMGTGIADAFTGGLASAADKVTVSTRAGFPAQAGHGGFYQGQKGER